MILPENDLSYSQFDSINSFLFDSMITQQSKGLTRLKGHSKSNSTDTLTSLRKRKFLSVVSAGNSN